MTAEQIKAWKTERYIARAIVDPADRDRALTKVYDHRDDMMLECIQHQADRVKQCLDHDAHVDERLEAMSNTLASCSESDREYRIAKQNAKAVKGFLGIVVHYVWPVVKKGIELIGAPTAAIIFCKITGILW